MTDTESVWCLTLHVPPEKIYWSTGGILGVISEQTKHTGIPFLWYEDTRICPGIRDARHQYFSASTQPSQTRHARPKRTDFMGEKQNHIRQFPLKPPDRVTTISLNPPDCATTITRLTGLDIKQFGPLAQGASRFEKLLANGASRFEKLLARGPVDLRSYWSTNSRHRQQLWQNRSHGKSCNSVHGLL